MYSPSLVAIARGKIERTLAEQLPRGLREYSVAEVQEFNEVRFRGLFKDRDKFKNPIQPTRDLTREEQAFVLNERILGKIDWRYFAERYCTINLAGQTLGPLFPLWESQAVFLSYIADIERENADTGYPDGICIDVLKARQMGLSTMSESIIAHRLVTHGQVNGLLASDVPDNSNFLYDMFERVVDNLPWYMRPTITERVKNDEMVFGTQSRLMMAASKSTRGADRSENSGAGKKGQIGRGKTLSLVHLSEIATWTNPGQIDTSLEPGIPITPFTFWVLESTAQGMGSKNWWYQDWQLAKGGKSRRRAVFIGWYMEPSKYSLPASGGWVPSAETLSVAKRIEETSPRWMKGRAYRPTRDQLFWYEKTRAEKTAKGKLEEFLQEYPADDEEAFQMSGRTIFGALIRERVKAQGKGLHGLVSVQPHREMGA